MRRIVAALWCFAACVPAGAVEVPAIERLKSLCLETELVRDGQAGAVIVAPAAHRAPAEEIAAAAKRLAGAALPVVTPEDPRAAIPFASHLVLLGNRSTNAAIGRLYDRYHTLVDLRWPGPGGHDLRTLHDPFGNGRNAVVVGASDDAGLGRATRLLLAKMAAAASGRSIRLGRLAEVAVGQGVRVTPDAEEAQTWEASAGYGSVGYFGWNSLSKRMALHYLTGDARYARDFLRLAFPDAAAKAQIARVDGERIEDKDHPLAGPYHYCAHMMILYWDLIEESPAFSDADRLRVTRAFADQLKHWAAEGSFAGRWRSKPSQVGSRHGQWAAISLYCLARYFQAHYPHPVWQENLDAAQRQFSPLHEHAWVSGENDNLFWYNTAIAPVLSYMTLTGDRAPLENGVLATLLRGQEILASGRTPDWALNSAALDFLHKAASLTRDGRWLTYRDRTRQDVGVFRLGQSFWPEPDLRPAAPDDLVGRWTIHRLPEPMWKNRRSGLALDESFQFGSFRSETGPGGDFVLLDGFNGASRNPYHTFALLHLRLDGYPILDGYLNQVIGKVDGLMEPQIAMDAALKRCDVIGSTALAVAEVPKAAYANWRRALALRAGRYALVVDALTYREASQNGELLFQWETETGAVSPSAGVLRFTARKVDGSGKSLPGGHLVMSDPLPPTASRRATMHWMGPVEKGQTRWFFTLLGVQPGAATPALDCRRLDERRAALALPGPGLAWCDGDGLGVLAEDHLFAAGLRRAPLLQSDGEVDVDWDFAAGRLVVATARPVSLNLALDSGPQRMQVEPGRHAIGARPDKSEIERALAEARRALAGARPAPPPAPKEPVVDTWPPAGSAELGGPVVDLEIAQSAQGPIVAAAVGNAVHRIGVDGHTLGALSADGPVRMLHWWPETGLLLAGCADEKVIAWDASGARRWTFVSEMDPAVFRAAKTYWFKSAPGHEGIHGLSTGAFLPGGTQAFVGSACTLEILDSQGKLVRRMPQFWGTNSTFALIDGPRGTRNLLVARKYNGTHDVSIVNSATLDPAPRGFASVPAGQTYVAGWTAMNRAHLFYEDLEGNGTRDVVSEINGVWNRVCVWDAGGQAKYAANFGPGPRIPAVTMRDLDVGDLDGDGRKEILAATSQGLVVALDGRCQKRWTARLASPAACLAIVRPKGCRRALVALGCDDGSLRVLDAAGTLVGRAEPGGKVSCLRQFVGADGQTMVAVGTASGRVAIYGAAKAE